MDDAEQKDDDVVSGLPADESPEPEPMGAEETAPDEEATEHLPGIPDSEDEPFTDG